MGGGYIWGEFITGTKEKAHIIKSKNLKHSYH